MNESKEYFALYSSNCMQCKHLSPETGTTSFIKCHFTKGNPQCPASDVQFAVVGEAHVYAADVLRARSKRWPKREARLMRYVAAQSKAFQSKFYEYLEHPTS